MKKLVPIYPPGSEVPKQWMNLRKAVYVTSFKYTYVTIPEILVAEYGLRKDEKIIVFFMKEISLPHFNRYRTKFKKVYSGSVEGYGEEIRRQLLVRQKERTKSPSDSNK